MLAPKIELAMAEHSMCQPGLPGPHGDAQEGSPGFAAFHSAKSAADFLSPLNVVSGGGLEQ
jgi:hypothetical protein